MFGWLASFWRKPQNPVVLEPDVAYDILTDNNEITGNDQINNDNDGDSTQNPENITKTGFITKCDQNNQYLIDNFYTIKSDLDLTIGTKISYQLIKTNGKITIKDINIIEKKWNLDGENSIEQQSTTLRRTLTRKVDKRAGRTLQLAPDDYSIDLNTVRCEFIPIIGDWIELDVICEIDENVPDLFGEIVEIKNITPLRPKIVKGKITHWDQAQQTGTIEQHIYFDKDALYCAYIPKLNDFVIVEAIESDQGLCSWRALKVISDTYYEKRVQNNVVKQLDEITNNLKDDHPNIRITDNIIINLMKLGDLKPFVIEIRNETEQNLLLIEIEMANAGNQCSVITDTKTIEIKKDQQLIIKCECLASTMGETKELLIFNFGDFRIKRWIRIKVGSIERPNSKYRQYRKDIIKTRSNREMIRGQRLLQPARFISTRLPEFGIPKNLLQLIETTSNDTTVLRLELERLKPVLTSPLTYTNYEDHFHTLIHLDEIHAVLSMRNYDQTRTCFSKYSEFLVLRIENLIDRRPSLIVGDRVIARDIYDDTKPDYEGFIHKIVDNDIQIKFAQCFHDQYDGEDYAVKMIASRTTYRRDHYAVSLAIKNLGKDLLFPSKVNEKQPQIQFFIDNDQKLVQLGNGRQLKLKWHNENLNCYQKEAVHNALLGVCRPLPYIIFGPPGTGKSVTIVEIVLQILALIPDARILLATPSNSAADLLANKLVDSGVVKPGDMVRFLAFTAINSITDKLSVYCATANYESPGTETQKPIINKNGLKLGCDSSSLGRHRLTVCTCSCAGSLYNMGFPKGHFSHIIIDEAGQTSEPNLMIPLSFMDVNKGQAILAGDPMQLGPVIISTLAAHYGLDESYLDRMINRFPYLRDIDGFPETFGYDRRLITKLVYNYRSLPLNLKLPSYLFYNDDLIPTISESGSKEAEILQRLESILPRTKNNQIASIVFHSVTGNDSQGYDSPSWFNVEEGYKVFHYLNQLYKLGLTVDDIGIITPYKAQVKLIQGLHRDAELPIPKIGTVEDFQGQEFNVIIMSTVRSSEKYYRTELLSKLGFVASPRRINVAISRARALLIIVGNPNLLKHDKTWQAIIQYCCDKGAYIK